MRNVDFTDLHNVRVKTQGEVTVLEKTSDTGWDASAISVEGIDGSDEGPRGVAFEPLVTHRYVLVGLASGCEGRRQELAKDQSHNNIDFAANIYGKSLRVFELGSRKGSFGHYPAGCEVEVCLNAEGKVEYRVDGQVRYISEESPKLPLYVKISANYMGEFVKNVRWIGDNCNCLTQAQVDLVCQEKKEMSVALASSNHHLCQTVFLKAQLEKTCVDLKSVTQQLMLTTQLPEGGQEHGQDQEQALQARLKERFAALKRKEKELHASLKLQLQVEDQEPEQAQAQTELNKT